MTRVKDIMKKRVITIKEDTDIKHICRILKKSNLSGLPVVNKKGFLVGFVSERDIIAAVPAPKFFDKTAKKIMTRKITIVEPDEPMTNVSKIFSGKKFRILPVVKGGKVVGIIARKDIIEHMLGDYV